MKNRILIFICCVYTAICLYACSNRSDNSTFNIEFIDVGQGDAALVECDGHYMLIDAGDETAGEKVYRILEEKGIQKLDILVMSHLHADHIGGLIKVLSYASSIDLTLSNTDKDKKNSKIFSRVEEQLGINEAKIKIPHVGDKYQLGSADIEVVDVSSVEENDSLVLLISYGDTRFLFTGDIEYTAQKRIADKYENDQDKEFKINLMKIPHHGAGQTGLAPYSNNDLNRFVRTFKPDYAVISVGANNGYQHPAQTTLDLLNQADVKVYRTDQDGDIFVKSDGKTVSIETSKSK